MSWTKSWRQSRQQLQEGSTFCTEMPEPQDARPRLDLQQADAADSARPRFINRELSWLQFNRRVLEEASNTEPSAARAAALPVDLGQQPRRVLHGARRRPRGQVREGISDASQDGLTPAEQLTRIARGVASWPATSRRAGASCASELAANGIVLVDGRRPRPRRERAWLEDHFLDHIFPVLTPLAIDPAHPFPFIPNLGFTLALQLTARATAGR